MISYTSTQSRQTNFSTNCTTNCTANSKRKSKEKTKKRKKPSSKQTTKPHEVESTTLSSNIGRSSLLGEKLLHDELSPVESASLIRRHDEEMKKNPGSPRKKSNVSTPYKNSTGKKRSKNATVTSNETLSTSNESSGSSQLFGGFSSPLSKTSKCCKFTNRIDASNKKRKKKANACKRIEQKKYELGPVPSDDNLLFDDHKNITKTDKERSSDERFNEKVPTSNALMKICPELSILSVQPVHEEASDDRILSSSEVIGRTRKPQPKKGKKVRENADASPMKKKGGAATKKAIVSSSKKKKKKKKENTKKDSLKTKKVGSNSSESIIEGKSCQTDGGATPARPSKSKNRPNCTISSLQSTVKIGARCNTTRQKELCKEERAACRIPPLSPKRRVFVSDLSHCSTRNHGELDNAGSPKTIHTKSLSTGRLSTRSSRWSFQPSILGRSSKFFINDENERNCSAMKLIDFKNDRTKDCRNSNKRWYMRPDTDFHEEANRNRFVMEMVFFS